MHKASVIAALTAVVGMWGWESAADDLAKSGRAIVADNRESVVVVRLVIEERFSFGGSASQNSESVSETTGTIIGKDGLTVASLAATNPSSMFEDLLGDMAPEGFQMSMDSGLSDVKLILDGGEEIPADVVLRDRDLDLIFVRPREAPINGYRAVDLDDGPSVQQFDQVALLSRLGKVANRALSGSFPRVKAVMEKPRTFYVVSDGAGMSLGVPAFALNGRFIGMTTKRTIKRTGSAGGGFMGLGVLSGIQSNMATVIVPAEDIAEAALQAPTGGESNDE